ncbi:MAG: hypothetical protein OXF65_04135 [Acidimicrobiaceae bacterium]|nr:hypothetical protein [Acidimicrobiaceae bacterium]
MKPCTTGAASRHRRLLAAATLAVIVAILPPASVGAAPDELGPTASTGESLPFGDALGGQSGNADPSIPFIGRYTPGAVATAQELGRLGQHCQKSDCLLLFLKDGESAIDALVRRAVDDRDSRAVVTEILAGLAADVHQHVAVLPGETEASFLADVENAKAALLAEATDPGSGLRHRGLDEVAAADPLASLLNEPGILSSGSLGLDSYLTNQFNWRGTHSFRYVLVTRGLASFSRRVGSIDVTYRMGLNGYQVQFTQEFRANPAGSQFVVADNASRCRVDLSRRRDRDCDAHPRPDNDYSRWLSYLRQPEYGYESVYDSSEERKFFEFGHDLRYRIAGFTSRYRTLWSGQSPRFTCDDDQVYRCVFD